MSVEKLKPLPSARTSRRQRQAIVRLMADEDFSGDYYHRLVDRWEEAGGLVDVLAGVNNRVYRRFDSEVTNQRDGAIRSYAPWVSWAHGIHLLVPSPCPDLTTVQPDHPFVVCTWAPTNQAYLPSDKPLVVQGRLRWEILCEGILYRPDPDAQQPDRQDAYPAPLSKRAAFQPESLDTAARPHIQASTRPPTRRELQDALRDSDARIQALEENLAKTQRLAIRVADRLQAVCAQRLTDLTRRPNHD